MRKQLLTIFLAGVLVLVVASCGAEVRDSGGGDQGSGGGKEGPIRLAVVPRAVGFSFWNQVRIGAECAASEHKDVKMQWDGTSSEADVSGQVDLLQNFMTQGVDGIVYSSIDEKVDASVTKNALDQGITVTNINTGTDPQPDSVPLFTTDQEAATKKLIEPLAEAIDEKGKVAVVEFQPGLEANEQRVNPIVEGLEKYPDIEIVARQSSDSDYNKALSVTENILTAHPDLDAIFAANEPSVLGAAEAVRNAGKAGEITIVGWDASSEEIKALEGDVITALVAQNPFGMGYKGVDGAVKMIREGTEVEGGDTGSFLVTKENVSDPEIQSVLDPSCENPPS